VSRRWPGALLTSVAAALREVLRARGETMHEIVMAVPVTAGAGRSGNNVAPLLVNVPTSGPRSDRMIRVTGTISRRRRLATSPPPIAVLGPVFRLVAAMGGYRWYMNRQHRLHTLVSYVRGPAQPVRFAGAAVRSLIPLVVSGAGNLTVLFQALSYGETLTVTAVVDADSWPDLDALERALRDELADVTAPV
jgi:diacylglycerol O-acyltransferase